MVKSINRLSPISVSRIKTKGLYADGGGLYLRVTSEGGKRWAYRFMLNGKAREMGLGALHTVDLAAARASALECRKLLQAGIDPIDNREASHQQAAVAKSRLKTFSECVTAYVEAQKAGWRSAKHAKQWTATLATFAYPIIGKLPVDAIDVGMVMQILEPIWAVKTETASRLRGRIELVLNWATTRGYRTGENPARWRGHLDNLLPRPAKVHTVEHQPALPYSEIGDFMKLLEAMEGLGALAMRFTILTASRTSEAIEATWSEIDMDKAMWIVPAIRAKGKRDHRVPLSDAALEILRLALKANPKSPFVFAGMKKDKPLSNMAMLAVLKRMQRTDITVHGFRSTFRDWCAERANYPREIAEAALSHISGDKVETAYLRSDHLEKRRRLMSEWSAYCMTPSIVHDNNVVKLRG